MDYLEKFLRAKKEEDWQIEEVDLNSMDVQSLTGESMQGEIFFPGTRNSKTMNSLWLIR